MIINTKGHINDQTGQTKAPLIKDSQRQKPREWRNERDPQCSGYYRHNLIQTTLTHVMNSIVNVQRERNGSLTSILTDTTDHAPHIQLYFQITCFCCSGILGWDRQNSCFYFSHTIPVSYLPFLPTTLLHFILKKRYLIKRKKK